VKRVAKHGMTAWVLCSLALAAAIVLPGFLGLERYVIVGDSMTGSIPKGSIVYARVVPVEQLKAGDVITFVPPGMSAPVTHRIASITQGADGLPVFLTKGDHNEVPDPWRTTFVQPAAARYAFHVPILGYALAAFAVREVRILLIALPALLISISLLWSVWCSAADSVRRGGPATGAYSPRHMQREAGDA
jgi:signal peptidase